MIDKKAEAIRSIKFVLFSISAGILQIVSFTLFNELTTWPYWVSYLISLVLSVVWNFTINRRYTFYSANNIPLAMFKVFIFYLIFTPTSTLLGAYLTSALKWNEYIVTALNMLLNFVLEFLYDRLFVFSASLDTNDIAKKKREAKS